LATLTVVRFTLAVESLMEHPIPYMSMLIDGAEKFPAAFGPFCHDDHPSDNST